MVGKTLKSVPENLCQKICARKSVPENLCQIFVTKFTVSIYNENRKICHKIL